MNLWPHQLRTIEAARAQVAQGKKAPLVCLPTGAGKTVVAVEVAKSANARGNAVLWIVHRIELVRQAADELRAAGVTTGIIAPGYPASTASVQVASIQTLIARDYRPAASVLVADEAHHLVAPTFVEVRRSYPDALVIGLTATPCRSDGVGLGEAFDCLVGEIQPSELIASGHLVPAVVKGPDKAVDALAANPVDAYREHCDGRRAIAFCASVQAAGDLAQEFTVAGYPARSVDGSMSAEARADAIAEFRAGRLQILTCMHVLTEGFDVRETGAVILARRMGSEAAYVQACGRAMRRAEGKSDAVVLDLMGSSFALGILPDSDRTYSLEGKGLSASNPHVVISQCRACGQVFQAHELRDSTCPGCGYVRHGRPDPKVVAERIAVIQAKQLETAQGKARLDWLRAKLAWCAQQRTRDGKPYNPNAAVMAFKAKFGCYPTKAMRVAAGMYSEQREAS